MGNNSSKVQCRNIFKNNDNIQKSFSLLWAEIISNDEKLKAGLENSYSLIYNKELQNYLSLKQKGVE